MRVFVVSALKIACRQEAGYSFVELLMALTILALVMVPVLNAFIGSQAVLVSSGRQTEAANLCRGKMESIKARGYGKAYRYYVEEEMSPETDYPGNSTLLFSRRVTVTSEKRELTEENENENENEEEGYLIYLLKIEVEVSWEEAGQERKVKIESYLSPR